MLALDFWKSHNIRYGVNHPINPVVVKINDEEEIISRVYKDFGGKNILLFNGIEWKTILDDTEITPAEFTTYIRGSDVSSKFLSKVIQSNKWHNYIGCDPELFIVDSDNNLVPAFERLRSKKASPSAYWDGFQAEFAPKAETCLEYLMGQIVGCLSYITGALKDGERMSLKNTFEIPLELLRSTKHDYVAFGCKPSYCAYGDVIQPSEFDPRTVPFRSAGGHLHFTLPDEYKGNEAKIGEVAKYLDRTLGVICVGLFQYWDTPLRRTMYGRAGEFRMPEYGVEYRVLSNAWLAHPVLYNIVFELARRVMGLHINNNTEIFKWNITEDEAIECINTCNVEMAREILNRNEESLKILLNSLPKMNIKGDNSDHMIPLVYNGFHTVLSDPDYINRSAWYESDIRYIKYWAGEVL